MKTFRVGQSTLILKKGDITKEVVDGIVNAANSRLKGGGGVDGAIQRAAGPQLSQACQKIYRESGYVPPGHVVITLAGRLKAKFVIHAVGPIWQGGIANERGILILAYKESLKLAEEHQLKSIAFPAISTGIFGYPIEFACDAALFAIENYLRSSPPLEVRLILFTDHDYEVYDRIATKWFLT